MRRPDAAGAHTDAHAALRADFVRRAAPVLFVFWGGVLPSAFTSLAYGWLLYSTRGRPLLDSMHFPEP